MKTKLLPKIKGISEQVLLDTINNVLSRIADKYKFGAYEIDDIKQEGFFEACKVLKKYDPAKNKLENFLFVCLKRRLINFRRNKYLRSETPCMICPLKAYLPPDGCSAYTDKMDCKLYSGWIKRNEFRLNINNTLEYELVNDEAENNMKYDMDFADKIDRADLMNIIDEKLPVELRQYYLMMLHGDRVPKSYKLEVEQAIIDIVSGSIYGEEYGEG